MKQRSYVIFMIVFWSRWLLYTVNAQNVHIPDYEGSNKMQELFNAWEYYACQYKNFKSNVFRYICKAFMQILH